MDDGSVAPLRGRDVALAAGIVGAILLLTLVADPTVRTSIVSHSAVRPVLCEDDLTVEVVTNDGTLAMPEGGVAVRVRLGDRDVPAHLELHRRDPGEAWRLAWTLEAPSGREVFYVATVHPGTEVYVLAKPEEASLCAARSPTLAAKP